MINWLKKFSSPIIFLIIMFLLYLTFKPIVIYIILSLVFFVLLQPVFNRIHSIKIKSLQVGKGLSSALSILSIFFVFGLLLDIIAPRLLEQAEALSSIDSDMVLDKFEDQIVTLESFIKSLKIVPGSFDLMDFMSTHVVSVIDFSNISVLISSATGLTGNILMATFCISFITFFMLKDWDILKGKVMKYIPDQQISMTSTVIQKAKPILFKYFRGVLIEVLIVIVLTTIGLSIFGVDNAFLIGLLAGVLNVIPYLGPIISAIIGLTFVLIGNIHLDFDSELAPLLLKCVGVFGSVQAIDNLVLQPMIHSNSVNAHPLEVFVIILMGGQAWGIKGMILAIPVYIVGKIFIKEYINLKTEEHN